MGLGALSSIHLSPRISEAAHTYFWVGCGSTLALDLLSLILCLWICSHCAPIRSDDQAAGVTALVVALLSLTLGVYMAFKLQVFQFPADGASSRRRGDRSMLEDILLNDG
jgi:hypothetical protein